jgi:hypothetical protein
MNFSVSVRRWLLGWVLVALLGAQALGHMHRVAHADGGSAPDAHAQEGATPGAPAGAGWFSALFAGHDDYSGCLSFDAVSHGGMAPPAGAAAPALPAVHEGVPHVPAAIPRCASAPFEARAPPLSR